MLIATNQNDRIHSVLSPQRRQMSPALLFSLGTLFAQHRMYQLAVDYLKQVPDQNADDAVYFNLGLSYSHLLRFDEARKCYFQAIDQRSGHTDAYLHVGLDYASSGQPRMGIPWLLHAHALAPARPDITYALVEQLIVLEYFDTAKELLQQGLNGSEPDPLLLVAAADLKHGQGDEAAALGMYRKALAQRPGLVPALVGVAKAEISKGNDTEAKKFLQEALSHDPDDPPANAELGRLEARDGDSNTALGHLQHAFALNHADTNVALEIARVYLRQKQPSSALRVLTSISSAMRHSPEFHFELARVYSLLGRAEDARAERDAFTNLQASARNDLRFESPRTYVY
jgi:predicted Zn-dependent protease